MAFYDLNWNQLPCVYSYPKINETIPRPKNLDLMIQLAEKLAAGFAHVRVDFYDLNDGSLKFGEMTFTSAGGACDWNLPQWDRKFGDLIQLPTKSPLPKRLDKISCPIADDEYVGESRLSDDASRSPSLYFHQS